MSWCCFHGKTEENSVQQTASVQPQYKPDYKELALMVGVLALGEAVFTTVGVLVAKTFFDTVTAEIVGGTIGASIIPALWGVSKLISNSDCSVSCCGV